MLFRSAAQMRDAAYRAADALAFQAKHPPDHVDDLVNQGLAALQRICRTTNPEFSPIDKTTVLCDGVATSYTLPLTFRSLISVEYAHDDWKRWLPPFDLADRARLTSPIVADSALCASGYLITDGRTIELLPKPQKGDSAIVWFATNVVQLDGDNAQADVLDRLDCYPVWWAARELANEREAWERYDRLTTRLEELEAEIRILARMVNTQPHKIVDQRVQEPYDRYGRRLRPWGSR